MIRLFVLLLGPTERSRVRPVGSTCVLSQISPRDAESFIAGRVKLGRAVATVNQDLRTLKGVFNVAITPRVYLEEGCSPFANIDVFAKSTCKPDKQIRNPYVSGLSHLVYSPGCEKRCQEVSVATSKPLRGFTCCSLVSYS